MEYLISKHMTVSGIPFKFISERVDLSWREIMFGLDHQLLAPKAAIDKAVNQLGGTNIAPKAIVELASLLEGDSVADHISCLANREASTQDEQIKAKWLYLVLAWLYENRHSLVDALGLVESVYSDFDYPKEMASFIRYMPMTGPDLGNREQNEASLFDKWQAYLDRAAERFAGKRNKSNASA